MRTTGLAAANEKLKKEIAERRRVEDALRLSEERFRGAFDYAPIGMALTGPDGCWLKVNRAVCEMLGYSEQELIGSSFQSVTHPDDLDASVEALRQFLSGEIDRHQTTKRYLHKAGRVVWVQLSSTPVQDHEGQPLYFVSQMEDITARRRAEEALRESEQLSRSILENIDEIIYIVSAGNEDPVRGIVQFVSGRVEQIIGYKPDEFVNDPELWFNLLHPDDVPAVVDSTRKIFQEKQSLTRVYRVRHKHTGQYRWMEDHVVPRLDDAGAVAATFGVARDITERKRAEEALRNSEEHFRTLFESATDGIFIANPEGGFEHVNTLGGRMIGYAPEELLGNLNITDIVAPEEIARVAPEVGRLRVGEVTRSEWQFRRKDGTLFLGEINGTILPDGRSLGFLRDITERKRAEDALRESEDRYRDLFEHSQNLICIHDLQGQILSANPAFARLVDSSASDSIIETNLRDILAPKARDQFEAYIAAIRRDGSASGLASIQTVSGEQRILEYNNTLRTEGVANPVVRGIAHDITERKRAEQKFRGLLESAPDAMVITDHHGEVVLLNSQTENLFGYSKAELLGQKIEILMPERFRDKHQGHRAGYFDSPKTRLIGAGLELHGLRKDGTEFPVEISLSPLEIEEGRLVISAIRDITERKRAEKALRDSEERYRDLVENSSELICTHDLEGRILSANRMAAEIMGVDSSNYIGKRNFREILAPEVRDRFDDYLARISKDGFADGIMLVQTSTGERRLWEYHNTLRTEGVAAPIVRGMARDITDRKRAEEALLASERKYRDIFTFAPVGIYQSLHDGTILTANRALAEMLAYDSVDEFLKVNLADVYFTPDEREKLICEYEDLGYATDLELRWKRKDGAPVWVQLTAHAIKENGLTKYFEGFVRDITERKQAEEALRESDTKFRILAETAASAIIMYQDDRLVYANPATSAITGYSINELVGMSLWDLVHPDFKVVIMQRRRARERGEPTPLRYEVKFIAKGGKERWADYTIGLIPFAGKPTTIVTAFDTTERKRAEAALRESEERYRTLFETAPDAVGVFDTQLKLIMANRRAVEMFGYNDSAEMIGLSAFDIIAPQLRARVRSNAKRVLEMGGMPPVESIDVRKDGTQFAVESSATLIGDAQGKPMAILGVTRDITERKLIEDALRESEERFRTQYENIPLPTYTWQSVGDDFVLLAYNRAAEEYTHGRVAELIGKSATELYADSPQVTNYLRRCYLERTAFSEEMLYRFRTLDEERYLQVSFAYVPPDLVMVHADDITERKRAQEELRTYSGRLIEAQEAERLRIARELHDQVGQILTVVQINLHAVQRACRTAEDSARVEDSIRVLDEALDQVHNLALDLRPSLLDDLGLAAALRWFVGRQARRTGVQPRILIELPDNMRFALELETACFRIAQEALTNVVRHAQAKRVSVELQKDETDLLLTIKDDGVGFDVKAQSLRAPNAATLGLLGMQERAHTVGGTIVIDSAPTKGTKIRCRFPIKARSQTDGFASKR